MLVLCFFCGLRYTLWHMATMTLSQELQWRGFINQTTITDLATLDKHQRTFYHGYDASADSQTVGNLAAMMFDKIFIRHGYKAILLVGGSTSLIGDPGGKNEERTLPDEAAIAHNIRQAEIQIKKVMTGQKFTLVNNLDWTKDLMVLPFLRDIGKHFSMTPLIQRDYIANRIGAHGAGLSYAEFSYTILQGYDYLHLFDKFGVTLQLGGSDQWGNCLSGVELIRKARGEEAHVVTHNLVIDKATGIKFGKSEDGAIWLEASKTTVYQFYQFWLNVDDESVGSYLKIFTELDKDEIGQVMTEFEQKKAHRLAQKTLAYEVTKLIHGKDQVDKQKRIVTALFGESSIGELNETEIATVREEVPHVQLREDVPIVDALIKTGLASSNSEAREFRAAGAVYVNNVNTTKEHLEASDFQNGRLILRRGKTLRNSALVEKP